MLSFLVALKPQEGGKRRKVLKMAQIEYIKHLYESEGKSLREIAQIVGLNFKTVQKYAYMNNLSPQILPNVEPEAYPILGPYIQFIDEWLEQDMREPRKQRHTAKRIHSRLCKEHGFKGSYASVKRYVVKKTGRLKKQTRLCKIKRDTKLKSRQNWSCFPEKRCEIGV